MIRTPGMALATLDKYGKQPDEDSGGDGIDPKGDDELTSGKHVAVRQLMDAVKKTDVRKAVAAMDSYFSHAMGVGDEDGESDDDSDQDD